MTRASSSPRRTEPPLTPDSLQALREGLGPFERPHRPPGLAGYQRFYQLDFDGRAGISHRIGTVPCGRVELAVQRWTQPGARHNLVLLHGYFDHVGLFGKLIRHALSRHCNVLAYDLPGHGLSSGAPAAIGDFDEYGASLAAALEHAALPDLPGWVMAQSTGAAALINFAGRYRWPFRDAVLLAPLLRPAHWGRVRLAHSLLHRFVASVPRRFAVNSSDAGFLEFLQRDPLQARRIPVSWVGALRRWLDGLRLEDLGVGPALVIQGDADTTVDWRYNLPQVGKLFPGSYIELLPGAGHHLANESQVLRQRYLRRVDRYIGLV